MTTAIGAGLIPVSGYSSLPTSSSGITPTTSLSNTATTTTATTTAGFSQSELSSQQNMTSTATVMATAAGGCKPVVRQCAGCGADILDRYLLNAIDVYWHTGCLRCSACQAPLADIGSTCFTRQGLILCRNDYLRMFGSTGSCAACGQTIGPHEMVLKTSFTPPTQPKRGGAGIPSTGNAPSSSPTTTPPSSSTTSSANYSAVYHVQCFTCAACHSRLVSGDRYRIVNGQVVCGDHEFGVNGATTSTACRTANQPFQHPQRHAAAAAAAASTPSTGTPSANDEAVGQVSSTAVPIGKTSSVAPSNATHHGGRSRQKVC